MQFKEIPTGLTSDYLGNPIQIKSNFHINLKSILNPPKINLKKSKNVIQNNSFIPKNETKYNDETKQEPVNNTRLLLLDNLNNSEIEPTYGVTIKTKGKKLQGKKFSENPEIFSSHLQKNFYQTSMLKTFLNSTRRIISDEKAFILSSNQLNEQKITNLGKKQSISSVPNNYECIRSDFTESTILPFVNSSNNDGHLKISYKEQLTTRQSFIERDVNKLQTLYNNMQNTPSFTRTRNHGPKLPPKNEMCRTKERLGHTILNKSLRNRIQTITKII